MGVAVKLGLSQQVSQMRCARREIMVNGAIGAITVTMSLPGCSAKPQNLERSAKTQSQKSPPNTVRYADEEGLPLGQSTTKDWENLSARIGRVDTARLPDATAHFLSGMRLMKLGRDEAAAAQFKLLPPPRRLSSFALDEIAQTYVRVDMMQDAAAAVEELFRRKAQTWRTYRVRAQINSARGANDLAGQDYERAADLTDDGTDAAAAAEVYRRLGKYNEAINVLSKTIIRTKSHPDMLLYAIRGRCFRDQKEWSKAVEDFSTVIDFYQRNRAEYARSRGAPMIQANVYLDRAKCFDAMGKHDLADRDRSVHNRLSKEIEQDIFGRH